MSGSFAAQVASMQAGRQSAASVLAGYLERIDATEPKVVAWEVLDREAGLREAHRLDAISITDRAALPLFGVPVGIKDVIDVAGLPTSSDFEPDRATAATVDAAVVERLRGAGAIVLGKTTTSQFAWGQDPPKTRNPWNLEHTPGASSTGSPAAVAAGHVPLAVGTQTTGSLLRPSSYCGVVGLKPSFGRVSCFGIHPTSWNSDHPGFVAKAVADVALALTITAGRDARDPYSAAIASENFVAATEVGRPARLGVLRDYVDRSDPEVRTGFRQALDRLSGAGADLTEISLPVSFDLIQAIHWTIQSAEGAAIHAEQFSKHRDFYLPTVRANVEVAHLIPAVAVVQARRLHRRVRRQMAAMLDLFDAIIAPTSSDRPPRLDNPATKNRLGSSSFQVAAATFGLPAISIPSGLGSQGLPMSVQLFTAPFRESDLLRAAAWCESILPALPEAAPL